MKKFSFFIFFLFTFILSFTLNTSDVFASENNVNAYIFYGNGCPHCAKENIFLDSIKDKYSNLNIYRYEIYFNQDNSKKMQEVSSLLNADATGVPFLIIGDKYFVGYSEDYSREEIESVIKKCSIVKCKDSVASILGIENDLKIEDKITETETEDNYNEKKDNTISVNNIKLNEGSKGLEDNQINNDNQQLKNEKIINLPFIGKSDINKVSIPILAILMGLLDGFNPCAMWTLLFLISLLLGIENKKRMWTLGIAFIAASASVYFIFMSAWLNLVLFLGIVLWVRLLIGGLAIFGGSYSIKSFFKNKNGGCEVTGNEKRQRVFEKLKNITKKNSLWIALGGIILLAFMVNLVELICSAGLPAVFTQVLAMNNLPTGSYYLYILLYILLFMIDDLFVFFVAMITLQMTGITTKYARYSHLIGGILMFIIGIFLIFKPEWLMFG